MTTQQPPPTDIRGDVGLAPAIDIARYLTAQDEPPPTLREAIETAHPYASAIEELVTEVGSIDSLEDLDDVPYLQDEFDWNGIDDQDAAVASDLLDLLDDGLPPYVDDETRTIIWRVLRALLLNRERPLDNNNKPARQAAAIAWVALSGSDRVGRGRLHTTGDIWHWFGVGASSDIGQYYAATIARANLGAARGETVDGSRYQPGKILLADPALLHSSYRRTLLVDRERTEQLLAEYGNWAKEEAPIRIGGDGQIHLWSRPTSVRWATKMTLTETGRMGVTVALGDIEDLELVTVSIPDAWRLLDAVNTALSEPALS